MESPGLRIDVSVSDGTATAVVSGELDLTSADSLQDRVRETIEAGSRAVRLDLGGLAFVDSTGLGSLVQCHRAAGELGVQFELTNVPDRVLRLMEITKLTELLPIVP
jgi:anti-sigma B factor antagonist